MDLAQHDLNASALYRMVEPWSLPYIRLAPGIPCRAMCVLLSQHNIFPSGLTPTPTAASMPRTHLPS